MTSYQLSLMFKSKTTNKGMYVYKLVTREYYFSPENYQDSQSLKHGNLLKSVRKNVCSPTFGTFLECQWLDYNVDLFKRTENKKQNKSQNIFSPRRVITYRNIQWTHQKFHLTP